MVPGSLEDAFKKTGKFPVDRSKGSRGKPTLAGDRRSSVLAPGYLANGYRDGKGNLIQEIFTWLAKDIARELIREGMSSSSLRKFFGKLRAVEAKYKASRDFESIKPDLYAFERDVAYFVGRRVVPEKFRFFIIRNVELATRSEQDFKGFLEHFQSVVAYFPETKTR